MDLRQLRIVLRDDVVSSKHRHTYEGARAREAVLDLHPRVESVLAVLETAGDARYPEREELTRALLREHRRGESPFWSSVLVVAYAPMLCRLRCRLRGDALSRPELDQLVLEAFFDALHGFPFDRWTTRVALYLRQQTQRAVFRQLRDEQDRLARWAEPLGDFSEEDEHPSLASDAGEDELDADEQAELSALVFDVGARVIAPERLEAIIATFVRGEQLHAFVARTHPGLEPDAHRAAYQRVKRQRHRALTRVAPILRRALSLRIEQHALHRQGALP